MENAVAIDVDLKLEALAEEFVRFRRGKEGRPSIPTSLRRMAVEVARMVDSVPMVAKVCGIAPQTLRNWVLAIPPPARRLAIALPAMAPECVAEEAMERQPAPSIALAEPIDRIESCLPDVRNFVFRLGSGVALEASPEQTLWLVRRLGGQ